MAKCGGSFEVNNVTLTFDDSATNSPLPYASQIVSGTNHPTSYAVATPPFPPGLTPPQPYGTNLSVFNGNNPNGAWSLYVIDDRQGNQGAISSGWSLNLTFAGVVLPTADVGLAMTAAPATVVATSNLVYTLTLTNYGPSTATNIVVTNTLPAGMVYVSSSPSLGNVSANAGVLSWTVNSLAKDATASLALVVQANHTGVITNTAGVTTRTSDLNPDDDRASAVVTVVSPTADLALVLADAPDPVLLGTNLTYTITVQNLGPATATGLVAYDTLPPTVNFISASPANSYTVVGQLVTFTNLGNLASGAQTSLTIVVQPVVAGTITDSASCYSGIVDPLKANNSAAVKTIVQSGLVPTLSISLAGSDVIIAWPVNPGNFILYSAPNLKPPVSWSAVTNSQVGDGVQNTVTVPISGSGQFFRLQGTP
jgi:uncharacterized repeat protein (TIGR01451 family)